MKSDDEISKRIWQLIRTGDEILMTATTVTHTQKGGVSFVRRQHIAPKTTQKKQIDKLKAIQWKTSSSHLLQNVFGEGYHFKNFCDITKILNFESVRLGIGVLNAAKEDYDRGFFDKLSSNNIESLSDIEKTDLKGKETPLNYEDILVHLTNNCDAEAQRNTRIYLTIIFESLLLISSLFFYFFGIKYASIFTIIILIISYLISAFSLKEWTPTKLPERILEIEKDRIYKRFDINAE